jgi:nucleotide-binding universal stress UspA family protein
MKTLLLLTDFSEGGMAATNAAFALAKTIQAHLELLHAVQVPSDWEELADAKKENFPEIRQQVNYASAQLDILREEAERKGIPVKEHLLYVASTRNFIHHLTALQKDLIIMGATSRNALEKFVLGTTTERMMRRSGSPILVVQQSEKPFQAKTVVFASGLESDTHGAFQRLLDFARQAGAQNLHFVEVTTPFNFMPSDEAMRRIRDFLAHHPGVNIQIHNYNHFNIESGIMAFARSVQADLIAIANHGRQDISSIFVESIPENLVRFGEVPVLSIKI